MLYKVVGGATIFIASLSIMTQIVLLPLIFHHSENIKHVFHMRMNKFQRQVHQFDEQTSRIRQLNGRGRRDVTVLSVCPEPYPGPPGLPGDPGPDGDAGDSGLDGDPGLDVRALMLEREEKCIICPTGPPGPDGPPGPPGLPGLKGDKGVSGIPGKFGHDGDIGVEGPRGTPGVSGKTGKRGNPGRDAVGGTGPPGGKGVRGPVGSSGPQGPRGKQNYVYGPPGLEGKKGRRGLDGLEGSTGPRGEKGLPGEKGANAKFCPCPIELKLVEGKNSKNKTTTMGARRPNISYLPQKHPQRTHGNAIGEQKKNVAYGTKTHPGNKEAARDSIKLVKTPKNEIARINNQAHLAIKHETVKNIRPFTKTPIEHTTLEHTEVETTTPKPTTLTPTTSLLTTSIPTIESSDENKISVSKDGEVHPNRKTSQQNRTPKAKNPSVNYEDVYPHYEQAKSKMEYDEDSVDTEGPNKKIPSHEHKSNVPKASGSHPDFIHDDDTMLVDTVDLPKIGSRAPFNDWPSSKYEHDGERKVVESNFDQFPQEPKTNRLDQFSMKNEPKEKTELGKKEEVPITDVDAIAEKLGDIADFVRASESKVNTDLSADPIEEVTPETNNEEPDQQEEESKSTRRRFVYVTKRPLPQYHLRLL